MTSRCGRLLSSATADVRSSDGIIAFEGLDELRLTITKERKPGVAKLPDSRRSSVTSPIDAKEYTYERGGGGGFGGGGGGGGVAGGNDVNGSISEDGDAFAAAAGVGGDAIASTSASAASSDAIAASSTVGRRSSRSTSISTSSSREWFGSEFYIEVQAYILEFVPWVDLLRGISQTCKVLNELVWTSRRQVEWYLRIHPNRLHSRSYPGPGTRILAAPR